MYLSQPLYYVAPLIYFLLGITGMVASDVWYGKLTGFTLVVLALSFVRARRNARQWKRQRAYGGKPVS